MAVVVETTRVTRESGVNLQIAGVDVFPELILVTKFLSGLYTKKEEILANRASSTSLPEASKRGNPATASKECTWSGIVNWQLESEGSRDANEHLFIVCDEFVLARDWRVKEATPDSTSKVGL
jgi:hypothetical protein